MRVLLFSVMVACGGAAEPTATSTPAAKETPAAAAPVKNVKKREDISNDAFAKLHAEGVTLIDVRTPGEFANGHVPGAVNVPLADVSASQGTIAAHDPDTPLYIICQSGGRSARASDALAKAGYTTINVLGGTGEWVQSGRAVE